MRWRHFVAANYRPSLVGILFSVGLCCHRNILVFRNTCLEPKWWFMRCHRVVLKIMFLESLIIESKKNCKLTVWWLNHHAINIIVSGRVWVGGKKKKRNKKVEVKGRKSAAAWRKSALFKLLLHKSLFTYYLFIFIFSFSHFYTCHFLPFFCYMLTNKTLFNFFFHSFILFFVLLILIIFWIH